MGYPEVENDSIPHGQLQQQPPGPPQQLPRPPLLSFGPGPVPIPQRPPSVGANFTFMGNHLAGHEQQLSMSNASSTVLKDTSPMSLSGASAIHASLSSATNGLSASNFNQASLSAGRSPMLASGVSAGPMVPGLPGIASPSVHSSSPSISTGPSGSSAPSMLAPAVPVGAHPSNPAIQPPVYPPYLPVPSAGASPQPFWLQPQPVGGLRPPFLPYPPVYSGPIAFAAPGFSRSFVPLPDAQPPGVTPVGNPSGELPSSVASAGSHMVHSSSMQSEVPPPGTDSSKQHSLTTTTNSAMENDQSDAWSAHRTEAGNVYYYNAITGESTYVKPSGFKGEPGIAIAQPSPVAWEKVSGTDWSLVTTNDGKKYYYNTITQISSWQVPPEVTELRKKQESDSVKENFTPVLTPNLENEKGSGASSISAPALVTGGRDATALRASGALGTASTLDLVKKKLQESGAQVTPFPTSASSGSATLEINGSKTVEAAVKALQSDGSKERQKDGEGNGNISESTSDSEDEDSGPTKEERARQFKEMLKERGVMPFSKWDKELPKIHFDPRFKAIPTYAERRSLFDHFVRTRAEEERKEKRAAQRAAVEGFKQLLEEAKEVIDHNTDYHSFRKRWGHDPRFESLERKEREALLNERVLPLKKAAEDKAQAERAAIISNFKVMLQERGDISFGSRWSKVKDGIRDDPRYKAVKHEERELLFNEFISDLKAADDEAEKAANANRGEQEKLKERERELRKRKEREEQEMERVRVKVRRLEAVSQYQALLVETIKDPQASWTESKPKLEKDPQGRASNPDLAESDLEKLFREHVKQLIERCAHDFKALLAEIITPEAARKETDGKTVLNSWSTAKRILKSHHRYTKMPRKDRESLWRRHVDDLQRNLELAVEEKREKQTESKTNSSHDLGRIPSVSRSSQDRR